MTDRKPDAADNVIELGVPVEQVWQAITTPEGLRSFLADEARVEPGVGGHIQIGWDGELMDPATIDVWEPGRRLRLHGNGVGEEWILEARGGRTVVRLVFNAYGDTDWNDTYDAFDDTGALILQLLAAWLDEHRGTPARRIKSTANLALDPAAAWAVALGPGGLAAATETATTARPARRLRQQRMRRTANRSTISAPGSVRSRTQQPTEAPNRGLS
jgi:uncharacterized protein YndB with AHSA1/START domain